jgi:hypothetical protein
MSGPATFYIQRRIGEELLTHGWHASEIATRDTPGSAWTLIDSSRRIRVRMSADFAAPRATITGTTMPGAPDTAPAWRTVFGHASSPTVVAAALAAVSTAASRLGTVGDRRIVARALVSAGMHPDRSRVRQAFTGHGNWHTDDARASAAWTVPRRLDDGGWRITTATLSLDATVTTPVTVLIAALAVSMPRNSEEPTS